MCSGNDECSNCKYKNYDKCEVIFGFEQGFKNCVEQFKMADLRPEKIKGEYFINLNELNAVLSQIEANFGIVEREKI